MAERTRRIDQSGFTLIEIAIVLVIIGLILGGILKGQELITSARVRALADQINGVSVAWFAFQDRYRGIPGDYNAASTRINAGIGNGNGNNVIDTDVEAGLAWAHLGASGMLAGTFDGAAVIATFNCPASTCPQNPFNRGMLMRSGDQSIGATGAGIGFDANELWSGNQIPALILAEMDRKVDDGLANSGRMQLSQNADGFNNSATCLNANGSDYAVLTNPNDCAVIMRNF